LAEKKLTIKQAKFLKHLTLTGSPTEAAMIAYDCKDRNSAKVIACENLTKLNVSFNDLMDKMGLSDEELTGHLKRHLKAKKTIGYLHNYKKTKDGKVEKVAPDESVSNEFIDVDDHAIQLKAAELGFKLRGKLRDKVDHSLDDDTKVLLKRALERRKKKTDGKKD